MIARTNIFTKIYRLYADGVRSMPQWGRQLWVIIIIKLFIMFAILRIFFFTPQMGGMDQAERVEYMKGQLIPKE